MVTTAFRLLIVAWVLFLLVRAARGAWAQRALTVTVWRAIRLRHVAGAFGLLLLVVTVAVTLMWLVPVSQYGLGDLFGFTGNAVFAPLEEAVARSGPAPATGPDWVLIAMTSVFLVPLAVMLPWLAFVEEEVFRAGLEDANLPTQLRAALVFGLAHLIMLVPVAAALAVGAAGFVYGRVYRRAHATATGAAVPPEVTAAYRATRRSAAAADRARTETEPAAEVMVITDRRPERRQAEAVLASTVWHATFNTMVVVLVWVSIVAGALTDA